MEATPEVIIVEEVAVKSEPSSFLLFLIFIPTFLIAYVLPLLATIYSKENARKWIFYWIMILIANLILKPTLKFIFGAYGGSFLFLVACISLLYISSNEKVIVKNT